MHTYTHAQTHIHTHKTHTLTPTNMVRPDPLGAASSSRISSRSLQLSQLLISSTIRFSSFASFSSAAFLSLSYTGQYTHIQEKVRTHTYRKLTAFLLCQNAFISWFSTY